MANLEFGVPLAVALVVVLVSLLLLYFVGLKIRTRQPTVGSVVTSWQASVAAARNVGSDVFVAAAAVSVGGVKNQAAAFAKSAAASAAEASASAVAYGQKLSNDAATAAVKQILQRLFDRERLGVEECATKLVALLPGPARSVLEATLGAETVIQVFRLLDGDRDGWLSADDIVPFVKSCLLGTVVVDVFVQLLTDRLFAQTAAVLKSHAALVDQVTAAVEVVNNAQQQAEQLAHQAQEVVEQAQATTEQAMQEASAAAEQLATEAAAAAENAVKDAVTNVVDPVTGTSSSSSSVLSAGLTADSAGRAAIKFLPLSAEQQLIVDHLAHGQICVALVQQQLEQLAVACNISELLPTKLIHTILNKLDDDNDGYLTAPNLNGLRSAFQDPALLIALVKGLLAGKGLNASLNDAVAKQPLERPGTGDDLVQQMVEEAKSSA